MMKTKDLFLNIAANPNMTLEDLASVGITRENTMLLDRALYASNEKVQNMFKDAEGNFNEKEFNKFYDVAQQSFNILNTDGVNLDLMNVTAYDVDNIYVDPSKRKRDNKPFITKLPNPDRLDVGIQRIGKIGPRLLSLDEIAQTQEVVLNPVDVANGAKPIYGKSPNDSWFENFWEPKVMAAWDSDGVHTDPITGKEVEHKKGDLKLNDNGTYYYENLNGRSVYGKRVLNKFNTLTTDGSAWNKYDFFDSDDIKQKSIIGSTAKNLALVGSMFIPYVGWGIAAASVAHQMAGLTATLGKMLVGADNEFLNNLEGFTKSIDRRHLKTEYALQNTWCWENFINMIGDTTALLREQRAIFKFAPGIIKGDFKALNEKAMKEYTEELTLKYMKDATNLSFKDLVALAKKQNPENWRAQLTNLMAGTKDIASVRANKAVQDYLSSYYKLGEPIARAYMTAITVLDTFGEAIQAGASNNEATLLTLGYAAAEAALLSTDLGKWIMPELRANRQRHKMIAKKLLELPEEVREKSKQIARLDGEAKKDWAKRLFNVGRNIMNAEYSTMKKTVGSVLASGLGEGIEEVSEEVLADFSKSCFNLVQLLQGDDVRLHAWNHQWDWKNAFDRYGMSFVGGIFGGSINAAASDYKGYKELNSMTSETAMQLLVYMTRNNELDDFWKTVHKMELAPKNLSTKLNENGIGYKPGTENDNLDLAAKRALHKLVELIDSIINAENAKLNDSGLLSTLIKADPKLKDLDLVKEYRMRALSNSATAGRFLNEWNTITSDIVQNRQKLFEIEEKYKSDKSITMSDTDQETLNNLRSDLKVLQERKNNMLNGERTREFVRDALFEMTHAVNEAWNTWATEIRYAEAKTGKKYVDISEEDKTKLKEEYETFKNSNQYAEKVHELADMYEYLTSSVSDNLKQSLDYYENLRKKNFENLSILDTWAGLRLEELIKYANDPDKGIDRIQNILSDKNLEDLKIVFGSKAFSDKLKDFRNKHTKGLATNDDYLNIEEDIIKETYASLNKTADEALNMGYVHPETLNLLLKMLERVQHSTSKLGSHRDVLVDMLEDSDDEEQKKKYNDELNYYNNLQSEIINKIEKLKELPYTPILNNLENFRLSTNIDKSVIDLIKHAIESENKERDDISTLLLDSDTLEGYKLARTFLEIYRSTIVGARNDNVDIDTIIGFNSTLNELSGKDENPKLIEIDANTADLVLADINKLLNRLDYLESIHTLNTGNKYSTLSKVALNKHYILFNRVRSIVSILDDEEEWQDKPGETSLQDLKHAINNSAKTLKKYAGKGKYNERNFNLTPDERKEIEKEMLDILNALHIFLNKHIDNKQESIDKLAKLFTYDRFKGLIRNNNDILEVSSEDIDDSAFIWWLCSIAAIDPMQFYNNYSHVIGQEKEGEKPIAPIPTQELGILSATAMIANGDMFSTFASALRKSLGEYWASIDDTQRLAISREMGLGLYQSDQKEIYNSAEFMPNWDHILFIEGIAGSGKTKGIIKTLSTLLSLSNPDLVKQKVLFAHTDQEKAKELGNSTDFTTFDVHDHDSLLKYMSPNYTPPTINDKGEIEYILGETAFINNGILGGNLELAEYNYDDVPKIIFIDEWSHYNLIELELIHRFASKYGVTIIATGDYDQITPQAVIKKSSLDANEWITVTPHRNMTPRVAKAGVSMRTDNEVKNRNIYSNLSWLKHPVAEPVKLHYYEDESGIYGDKNYSISTNYGAELDSIKKDVEKMIATLKSNEKIGYIHCISNQPDSISPLYKWLTETPGIKEHILPYSEKEAHGREALYYIIENNLNSGQDAKTYFSSIYTGITRSELGSIVITNNTNVTNGDRNNKYNKVGLSFQSIKDAEMVPNSFTDEGTRAFSARRKLDFRYVFGDMPLSGFQIQPRTRKVIKVSNNSTTSTPTPTPSSTSQSSPSLLSTTQTSDLTPSQSVSESTTSEPPTQTPIQDGQEIAANNLDETSLPEDNPTSNDNSENNEEANSAESTEAQTAIQAGSNLPPTRTPEPQNEWEGPLPQGLKLYDAVGNCYIIANENSLGYTNPHYELQNGINSIGFGKDLVDKPLGDGNYHFYTKLPTSQPKFKIGDEIIYKGQPFNIDAVILSGPNQNNPYWVYVINDKEFNDAEIQQAYLNGDLLPMPVPTDADIEQWFDNLDRQDYELALIEDLIYRDNVTEIVEFTEDGDINFNFYGFTFNTFYAADSFDKEGNLDLGNQLTQKRNAHRIDNGYGLYNLNKDKFHTKKEMLKVLGPMRKWLQYKSQAECCEKLRELLGIDNIKMQWAFISKSSKDTNKDFYSRFNTSLAVLDYTFTGEENHIPIKTLSAVFFDENNNAILEIPMVTLYTPHRLLAGMLKIAHNLDLKFLLLILDFINKAQNKSETDTSYYNELLAIQQHIQDNYSEKKGLTHLANIIKLWLFTHNGIKFLNEDWNLYNQKNLGPLLIDIKTTLHEETQNYYASFTDLNEVQRPDRFMSSILMGNVSYIEESDKQISLPERYTPYVLVSDHPDITDDTAAVRQYLRLIKNPQEPKLVKYYPVTPPEVSVSTYIQSMYEVRTHKKGEIRISYGNKYTPYRIFNAILQSEYRNQILAALKQEDKEWVIELVNALNRIEDNNPKAEGEHPIEYAKNIANMQNPILKGDSDILGVPVYQKLRNLLVLCVFYLKMEAMGTESTTITASNEILQMIEQACEGRITGVLCQPRFRTNSKEHAIEGVSYQVAVDENDLYRYPEQGYFRICGKIDPSTYVLNPLLTSIDNWANEIRNLMYYTPDGQRRVVKEVLVFDDHLDANNKYFPKENNQQFDIGKIIKSLRELLGKLDINELNIDRNIFNNCKTELQAKQILLQHINDIYKSIPGNFIILIGQVYKYGNLNNIAQDILNSTGLNISQYSFKTWNITPSGMYKLTFEHINTNESLQLEMQYNPNRDEMLIEVEINNLDALDNLQTPFNVENIKQEVINNMQRSVMKISEDLKIKLLNCYDINTNTIDLVKINQLLNEQVKSALIRNRLNNILLINNINNSLELNICSVPISIPLIS